MQAKERIAAILEAAPRMTRGKLCVSAVRKSGKKAYNLQYRRKTRHFVKAVPSDQVALFEESTRACREFLELVQSYIDEATERGIREIEREAARAKQARGARGARRAGRDVPQNSTSAP
jgi:hypothetical protein